MFKYNFEKIKIKGNIGIRDGSIPYGTIQSYDIDPSGGLYRLKRDEIVWEHDGKVVIGIEIPTPIRLVNYTDVILYTVIANTVMQLMPVYTNIPSYQNKVLIDTGAELRYIDRKDFMQHKIYTDHKDIKIAIDSRREAILEATKMLQVIETIEQEWVRITDLKEYNMAKVGVENGKLNKAVNESAMDRVPTVFSGLRAMVNKLI